MGKICFGFKLLHKFKLVWISTNYKFISIFSFLDIVQQIRIWNQSSNDNISFPNRRLWAMNINHLGDLIRVKWMLARRMTNRREFFKDVWKFFGFTDQISRILNWVSLWCREMMLVGIKASMRAWNLGELKWILMENEFHEIYDARCF